MTFAVTPLVLTPFVPFRAPVALHHAEAVRDQGHELHPGLHVDGAQPAHLGAGLMGTQSSRETYL